MTGKFVVVTGPSASGKTSIVDALLKQVPNSTRLVTCTTRKKRPHEQEGDHYHFLSREEFEKRAQEGEFFEQAEVYGNLYGSSKKVLDEELAKDAYVFGVIDVQGAQTIKKRLPDTFVLFMKPANVEDVFRRLKEERKETHPEELAKRIEITKHELELASTFDAVVENVDGKFDETLAKVRAILGIK